MPSVGIPLRYINPKTCRCALLPKAMNRNILYLIIGVLVAAVSVFGYLLYQERQKTTGIEINIGKSGISIEKK